MKTNHFYEDFYVDASNGSRVNARDGTYVFCLLWFSR